MINPEKKQFPPIERFHQAVDIFEKFSTLILFELGKNATTTRDMIIRNFIARSVVSLKGIMKLWDMKDYHDCWILFRCLLDRLFHLNALAENNEFEIFEKWSFKQQYDSRNKVRSDLEFKNRLNPEFYLDTNQQKQKYKEICKEKIEWKRPKPETIAKQMNLDFLYKYGYDYASRLVHPMANDGQEDFYIQLNLPEIDKIPDYTSVLQNSCLTAKLIIQEGLNHSSFKWRTDVFDFLDNFLSFLETGSMDWLANLKQVMKYYEAGSLSEPSQK